MLLTPTELQRLARKRRARGLWLNHPEAIALITDEILEWAHDGRSVAELMAFGAGILTSGDVMPGVPEMVARIQVECTFPDGTKLVHDPIRPGTEAGEAEPVRPGETIRPRARLSSTAASSGRASPRQHRRPPDPGRQPLPLLRANRALEFDRRSACTWTSRPAPRPASSPATARKSSWSSWTACRRSGNENRSRHRAWGGRPAFRRHSAVASARLGVPLGYAHRHVFGSLAMGALIELMAIEIQVSPEIRAFLAVGLLGGFTTFSAFSLDVAVLYGRGAAGLALAYVLVSLIASIGGLFVGLWLVCVALA